MSAVPMQAIKALTAALAPQARALRGDQLVTIDAADLVPGDIILLAIGNIVPADVKLLGEEGSAPVQAWGAKHARFKWRLSFCVDWDSLCPILGISWISAALYPHTCAVCQLRQERPTTQSFLFHAHGLETHVLTGGPGGFDRRVTAREQVPWGGCMLRLHHQAGRGTCGGVCHRTLYFLWACRRAHCGRSQPWTGFHCNP